MFPREAEAELLALARDYPVVTVTGPRQSGKTTLVKHAFPKKSYVNLEALDIRDFATLDPRGFLEKYPEGAILDEIQRVPTLLSYIQVIVDESDLKGKFILTGSHQLELHQAITQSLAGRTAMLNLLPMSLRELRGAGIHLTLDGSMLQGGYPRIFKDHLDPTKAYRNYFQTYIERDLRELIQVKDLNQFQRFIKICAGRIGQILNMESIGNDVGVTSKTVKEWISILEASFILFKLQPYFENFGKRIIKAPKIYFYDVGLASFLLGIENEEQLSRDPLRGHLMENLVVLELLKARLNKGLDPQLYFFRDVQGHEVDLIFQTRGKLVPVEIKASKTFNSGFLKNIEFFRQLIGDRYGLGSLIYAGDEFHSGEKWRVLNYKDAAESLE